MATDFIDDPRMRFDEFDGEVVEPSEPVCGDCPQFVHCGIKGHEDIGWCGEHGDFCFSDDPDECNGI